MRALNLIMSGAYVERELMAEFGKLPPAFLPVGVGRLYDLQIEAFRKSLGTAEKIYCVLPESFEVPSYDQKRLEEKSVSLLFVPDGTTLGESLIYAINMLTSSTSQVRVLHGDTLLDSIPKELDCVSVHEDSDDYAWAAIQHNNYNVEHFFQIQPSSEVDIPSLVVCGFFSFSSSTTLTRSIISSKYNFIDSLNKYNQIHNMEAKKIISWYDFGHLQNYFHSRRLVTTARAFNSMLITKHTVEKSSRDHFKMKAEANWLTEIPLPLQPYSVRMFGKKLSHDSEKSSYITDYQYAPNLAELFVFSKVGRLTWGKIFSSCISFLEECSCHLIEAPRDQYLLPLVFEKTNERIETYSKKSGFDLDHDLTLNEKKYPSLRKISKNLQSFIKLDSSVPATVMHGDFCFSNILYNARTQRISVIDPRGYVVPNAVDIYGDIRYDIAKFSHSVNGFYDLIVAGHYSLEELTPYDFSLHFADLPMRDWLSKRFSSISIGGISASSNEIKAIMILLFVSMLPLHEDRPDRQKAFIANVLRLYGTLEGA